MKFTAFATFLVATTLILPSLAAPLNAQGSEDLLTRDYEASLMERDFTNSIEPLSTREFGDDIDIEAREPGKALNGLKKFLSFIFRRQEFEDTDLLD